MKNYFVFILAPFFLCTTILSQETTLQLPTNDNTSSFNVTKNNGTDVLKVDGSGKMSGDGSGLSNVKSLTNYIGGNQRFQVTANYGSYNAVRTVVLTVPGSGVCYAVASGYLDWESTGWDLYLGAILMDKDPNSSWTAENEWYSYLNIVTDYNCTDSSDQYTSFAQQRCFPVSAGTHTFYLWVNKYSSASKTELGDVNLTVIFIPTGGTGSASMSVASSTLSGEENMAYSKNDLENRKRELHETLDGTINGRRPGEPLEDIKINTRGEIEAMKKELAELKKQLNLLLNNSR